jgi:hypothetical protein
LHTIQAVVVHSVVLHRDVVCAVADPDAGNGKLKIWFEHEIVAMLEASEMRVKKSGITARYDDAMHAFKVDLNGKRICVAGVGQHGVLTAIVDYVGDGRSSEISLRVGGLFTPTEEHATWKRLDLKVGDKVVVTVIETDSVDRAGKRYRPDSKTYETNQKAYVQALAKKFGWKITRPRKSK